MASIYQIQIIDRDSGKVLKDEPGGPLEVDLIAAVEKRLLSQPIGVFTTRAQVSAIVTTTIREVIRDLKRRV